MKNLKIAFLVSFIAKLFLATLMPLSDDEAYYWIWSLHPQLSYFDHPPVVSWLFQLSKLLPTFAVRWPAVIISHIGLLGYLVFLKKLNFNDKQMLLWLLLALCTPLIGFAGIIVTPDLPLMACLGWLGYFFLQALESKKISFYAGFGLLLGIALSSKYHAAIFCISLLAVLYLLPDYRKKVSYLGFSLAILFSLIGFFPVILWNYQNDWASFSFQTQHGFAGKNWSPSDPIRYLLGQILIITPFLWPPLFQEFKNRKLSLLNILSLLPIVFFLFSSFRNHVEANWTNIAFPFLLALAIQLQIRRHLAIGYAVTWSLLTLLFISQWTFNWLPNAKGKLNEPYEFSEIKSLIPIYQPFYAGSYQMAAQLSWQGQTLIYKLPGIRRYDFFDTLKSSEHIEPKFYLAKEYWVEFPGWTEGYQRNLITKVGIDYEIWEFQRQ